MESRDCEITQKIKIILKDDFNNSIKKGYKGQLYMLDGATEEIRFSSEGIFEKEGLIPGKYKVKLSVEK